MYKWISFNSSWMFWHIFSGGIPCRIPQKLQKQEMAREPPERMTGKCLKDILKDLLAESSTLMENFLNEVLPEFLLLFLTELRMKLLKAIPIQISEGTLGRFALLLNFFISSFLMPSEAHAS